MRIFLLLFVLMLAVASAARAQTPPPAPPTAAPPPAPLSADDEAAREHFESGRAYYQRAQYDDAAREFGEAYRLSHRAALLLNASRALEGAGRFDDAASAVQQYLDTAAADDPDREGAPERLARLRASAERMRVNNASRTHAPPRAHTAPPSGLSDMQVAGIVVGASSVLVGVVGLIVGLVADGLFQSLKMSCPGGLCPASRQGDIDTGNAEASASTLLFGFAVVGVCTGLLILIFGGNHAPPAAPHAANPVHWLGTGVAIDWSL